MSAPNPDANQRVGSGPNADANGSGPVGHSPGQFLQHAAAHIAPNTAITSTEHPPGDTQNAVKTGSAVPAASLAHPDAVNAGARAAGAPGHPVPDKVEQRQAAGSSKPAAQVQGSYEQVQTSVPQKTSQQPAAARKQPPSSAPSNTVPVQSSNQAVQAPVAKAPGSKPAEAQPSILNNKVCIFLQLMSFSPLKYNPIDF